MTDDNVGDIVVSLLFWPPTTGLAFEYHFMLDDNRVLWAQRGLHDFVDTDWRDSESLWESFPDPEVYLSLDVEWVGRRISQRQFNRLIAFAEQMQVDAYEPRREYPFDYEPYSYAPWNAILYFESEFFYSDELSSIFDRPSFDSLTWGLIGLSPLPWTSLDLMHSGTRDERELMADGGLVHGLRGDLHHRTWELRRAFLNWRYSD
jgi:hypothetical protein